jgi:hypothetical protein
VDAAIMRPRTRPSKPAAHCITVVPLMPYTLDPPSSETPRAFSNDLWTRLRSRSALSPTPHRPPPALQRAPLHPAMTGVEVVETDWGEWLEVCAQTRG